MCSLKLTLRPKKNYSLNSGKWEDLPPRAVNLVHKKLLLLTAQVIQDNELLGRLDNTWKTGIYYTEIRLLSTLSSRWLILLVCQKRLWMTMIGT